MSETNEERRKSLCDKVRKLIAKARQAPAEEADAAIAIAARLMEEHGIREEELAEQGATTGGEWCCWSGSVVAKLTTEQHVAARIVQAFFHVRAIVHTNYTYPNGKRNRRQYIELFGRPEHVAVAEYVMVFLTRELGRRWRLFVGIANTIARGPEPTGRTLSRAVWMRAAQDGIADRIRETVRSRDPNKRRLIAAFDSRLLAAVKAHHAGLRDSKPQRELVTNDVVAATHGYRAGHEIEIRKPLPGQTSPAAIEATPRRIAHVQ